MRLSHWLKCLCLASIACITCVVSAAAQIAITDDAGREVRLAAPAERIILTDGMGFLGLLLIDDHPVRRLAGWNRRRLDDAAQATVKAKLPEIAAVPDIGEPDSGGSVEALIALGPDLVVLDPYYNRSPAAVAAIEAAGIRVAVLAITPDIRSASPHAGLIRLGILIGRETQARAYAAFADAKLARIRDRLSSNPNLTKPLVLVEAHAGASACCISPGAGQGIGDFVAYAGGRNIGADVIPGMAGPLSPEYILERAPQIYIATGGAYLAASGGLIVGPDIAPQVARERLSRVAARLGVRETPAAANGRVHGLWHGLAVSAMNVVAVEAMARWIHPEFFSDIDPEETIKQINRRFSAVPLTGAMWISQEGAP
jgi:iron complex transport system substrate-binding protein